MLLSKGKGPEVPDLPTLEFNPLDVGEQRIMEHPLSDSRRQPLLIVDEQETGRNVAFLTLLLQGSSGPVTHRLVRQLPTLAATSLALIPQNVLRVGDIMTGRTPASFR